MFFNTKYTKYFFVFLTLWYSHWFMFSPLQFLAVLKYIFLIYIIIPCNLFSFFSLQIIVLEINRPLHMLWCSVKALWSFQGFFNYYICKSSSSKSSLYKWWLSIDNIKNSHIEYNMFYKLILLNLKYDQLRVILENLPLVPIVFVEGVFAVCLL